MIKHYIVVDGVGNMVGYQMAPGEIINDCYIEVTPEVYQRAMAINMPYEGFKHIGNGQFEVIPDSRPLISITVDALEISVGGSVTLHFTRQDGFTGSVLIDYDSPSRVQKLIQLSFMNGVASFVLTCAESGVYRFIGGRRWRTITPVEISVYEV